MALRYHMPAASLLVHDETAAQARRMTSWFMTALDAWLVLTCARYGVTVEDPGDLARCEVVRQTLALGGTLHRLRIDGHEMPDRLRFDVGLEDMTLVASATPEYRPDLTDGYYCDLYARSR